MDELLGLPKQRRCLPSGPGGKIFGSWNSMWAASVVSRSWLGCVLRLYPRLLANLEPSELKFEIFLRWCCCSVVAVLLQRCCNALRLASMRECGEKYPKKSLCAMYKNLIFKLEGVLTLRETLWQHTFNNLQHLRNLLDWVPCTMPLMEAPETRYEPGSYDPCGKPSWSRQLNGSHHLHPIELPSFFYCSTLPDQWVFCGWKIE